MQINLPAHRPEFFSIFSQLFMRCYRDLRGSGTNSPFILVESNYRDSRFKADLSIVVALSTRAVANLDKALDKLEPPLDDPFRGVYFGIDLLTCGLSVFEESRP